jgi:glycosyltransferase involved in cell wall biosynthesis
VVRLAVSASALRWPACGTRTYLRALLQGFQDAGLGDGVDLLLPRGHAGARLTALSTAEPVRQEGPLRYSWLWEQGAASLPLRGGTHVLFTPYAAPASRRLVPHQVFALLDTLPWHDDSREEASPVGRRVLSMMARHARQHHAVAISEFTRQEGIARLGLRPEAITSVPLAAAPVFFPRDRKQVAVALAARGLDRPFALYVGGFSARKRPELLLEAFLHDPALRHDLDVVFVGATEAPPSLGPLAMRAAALGVRTAWLGSVPDEMLACLYSGAAVTCYLSDYEGFGLPPVEAAACGSRVVASALPPLRESLGDRPTYVASANAPAVASALHHALNRSPVDEVTPRTWVHVAAETWAVLSRVTPLAR